MAADHSEGISGLFRLVVGMRKCYPAPWFCNYEADEFENFIIMMETHSSPLIIELYFMEAGTGSSSEVPTAIPD